MTSARTIGIGLVGAGWMGALHTASYRDVRAHYPECMARPRLVIAADEVEERANAAVNQLGYETATLDPLEVVNHPDVEAVSIAATNDAHLPVALAAAAAGKHFWIEKPVGRFPQETAEIAAAAEAADVRTIVGFNYRHAPAVVHAHRLISSGELGEIRTYRGHFLVDYASSPERGLSWRFSRKQAGLGVLGDLMSHTVDLAHFLVGPIESVSAQSRIQIAMRPKPDAGTASQFSRVDGGQLGEVENEDHAVSLVQFANGALGVLEVGRAVVGRHNEAGLDAHGTRGALSWEFQRLNELELYLPGIAGQDVGYTTVFAGPQHGDFGRFEPGTGIPMGYDDLKVTEAFLFLDSIATGRQHAPGLAEALDMARVIDAMQRSIESGGWEQVRSSGQSTPPARLSGGARTRLGVNQ